MKHFIHKVFYAQNYLESSIYVVSKSYGFQYPLFNKTIQSNPRDYCEFMCNKVNLTKSTCYGKYSFYSLIHSKKNYNVKKKKKNN